MNSLGVCCTIPQLVIYLSLREKMHSEELSTGKCEGEKDGVRTLWGMGELTVRKWVRMTGAYSCSLECD